MRLVVDTETNAIDFTAWNRGDTSSLKTVHCVCALDIDERREYRWRGKDVRQGINFIALNSQEIIGFNLDFDYRVMCQNNRIVMPSWVAQTCVRRRAKSAFPDGYNEYKLPRELWGRHSLEAWGLRLGMEKSDFGKSTDWTQWSEEMEDYCMRDVHVTAALFHFLENHRICSNI